MAEAAAGKARAAAGKTRDAAARSGAAAGTARAEVVVDLELCKACGICAALCPRHVFDCDAEGRAVVARLDDCTVCRICEWHCPDFAIEVLKVGARGGA